MKKLTKEQIDKALKVLKMPADSKLITHLNACVHCGLCATSCMYFIALQNDKYTPARKVELVASLYRRYCTLTGKIVPKLVNARELDEQMAEEMIDILFGACTMCGRCVKHCSIGVDIAYIVRVGRQMLAAMDLVPATLQATVDAALTTGNNMAIPTEEFVDTIQWMEEELLDEMNDKNARIPLDEKDKHILYTLNPREPKFFPLSISAMAKVFYAAKESWTLSSKMYDVTNYGLFSGNNEHAAVIAQHLYDEVKRLNANTLVLGECGHGSRATRWEGPNYLGMEYDFDVITVVELINDYIRSGRIKLDKSLIKERVTMHDPCHLSRNGGLESELRFALNNSVSDFVEMTPHGFDNFCCGGGGGQLAMSEYNDRRIKIGEIKAEQIRKTGASIVVTPCHNCIDQLMQINHTYKLNVKIKSIAEIVADALVIEK
ncbi:MAG: succinate dehydrogenase/fumarate reductase iron-sulfur subunit [Bacteroidetes bacterium ADurb.Bin234]|nr:MAG: succinate dehydrogenase/fumarate reductase iron-sulfur subunit [Bacteroidetes bacterium ADurb.Bin234]